MRKDMGMVIADFYELSTPFCKGDFPKAAALFFHNLGYTEKAEIVSRSSDSKLWIYDLIGYETFLSEEERFSIGQIKEACELHSICFGRENVRLLAIALSPYAERSQTAYQLQEVISKGPGKYSIILFSQERDGKRECLLSVDSGRDIILSDWFSIESDAEKLLSISGENLTCSSAREFVKDFAYQIGRWYYWVFPRHALRFELLQYNSLAYLLPYGAFDWYQLFDDVERLQFQDVYEYGDDFIEPCPGDGNTKKDQGISVDILFTPNSSQPNESLVEEKFENTREDRIMDETDLLIEKLGDRLLNPIDLLAVLDGTAKKTQEAPDKVPQEISSGFSEIGMAPKEENFTSNIETCNGESDEALHLEDGKSEKQELPSLFPGMGSELDPMPVEKKETPEATRKDSVQEEKSPTDEKEQAVILEEVSLFPEDDEEEDTAADIMNDSSNEDIAPIISEISDTEDTLRALIADREEKLFQINTQMEEKQEQIERLKEKKEDLESEVERQEKSAGFSISRAWKRLTAKFSRRRNALADRSKLEKQKKEILVINQEIALLHKEIGTLQQEKIAAELELKEFTK